MIKPPVKIFLAVNLPKDVQRYVLQKKQQIAKNASGFSFVAEGNHHITLVFLGEIEKAKLFEIKNALTSIGEAQFGFTVETGRFILFPTPARARMVWLEIIDPDGHLTRLHTAIKDALVPLGFDTEERKFHPHITIARRKKPQRISRLEETLSSIEIARQVIAVQSIDVMNSVTKESTQAYDLIDRISF